jgi:endonuclease/exonuclease/phosphatase (EEP) superfamily protein YafD
MEYKILRLNILLWGLFTAAGVVLCTTTVFGSLGRFSWFLDLFSHFRVQYLFGLSILGLLLLIFKRRKTATIFLAFAGINLAIVLPLYFGGQAEVPESAYTLRALLLNVNTRFGDANRVKHVIQEFDADIVVLEEISSQWVEDLQWLTVSHPHFRIQPREDNFGIGLFSKFPLREGDIVYIGDAKVPSIDATLDIGPSTLGVIATHPLPPGSASYSRWRNDQLDKIAHYVLSNSPMLLLGDLNVTPWNHYFKRLLKHTGLRDSSQGRGIQPTWPNFNPLLRIPIDHCLHSPDILVTKKQIGPDVGSDHYPVIIDFTTTTTRKNAAEEL